MQCNCLEITLNRNQIVSVRFASKKKGILALKRPEKTNKEKASTADMPYLRLKLLV